MEENKGSKKVKIFKLIVAIIVLIILIIATIYIFPIIKNISRPEGRIEFKERIQDAGPLGFLMLMGLELAQIFLAILPGEPLEILAGMCFGGIGGTLVVLLAILLSTIAIFFIVRKFGKKFIYEFISKERVDKIENSKLFKNPKKIEKILIIIFLIPGTPKDFLVYLGGILPIKASHFIAISTLARIPSIISSTLAGANLIEGSWKTAIALYALVIIIVAIAILIYRYTDKDDKETEEVLKTIK